MAAVAVGVAPARIWDPWDSRLPSEDGFQSRPSAHISRSVSQRAMLVAPSCRPASGLLESWLADETQWQQARIEEVPQHTRPYRVVAPSDYPGIQYRRTKNLADRYHRYAPTGSIVYGYQEDASWLRVAKRVYVPMTVDGQRVLEPCVEAVDSLSSWRSSRSSWMAHNALKADVHAAVHPSTNWLCAAVPGTCNTTRCAVAPCVDTIEVLSSQREFDPLASCTQRRVLPKCVDDVADASTLSERSLQPSLPTFPRRAPPSLPTRAPSGDHAVDAAERLLARVVDPFGAME